MADPATRRDLSLSLIGLAGAILIGGFAALKSYLDLASPSGDELITVLLIASTICLTISIILGGRAIERGSGENARTFYNWQAIFGLLGLLAALAMPSTSLLYPEQANQNLTASLQASKSTLMQATAEWKELNANNELLLKEVDNLSQRVEQLEVIKEVPSP